MSIEPFALLSVTNCQMSLNYHEAFIVHMASPAVLVVAVGVGYMWTLLCRTPPDRRHRQRRRSKGLKCLLVVGLLLFPGIATRVFGMFVCRSVPGMEDTGEEWLARDWRIQCWEGEHRMFVGLAVFFGCLYIGGLPVIMFACLQRNRQHLYDKKSPLHEQVQFELGGLYSQVSSAHFQ